MPFVRRLCQSTQKIAAKANNCSTACIRKLSSSNQKVFQHMYPHHTSSLFLSNKPFLRNEKNCSVKWLNHLYESLWKNLQEF